MATKLVVLGDVNGQFRSVFAKLTQLYTKHKFVFGLVAGDFFADPATATEEDEQELQLLLGNQISVPFQIYLALGKKVLPPLVVDRLKSKQDEDLPELCSNLTFLGKRTKFTTSEGVRIVALGGQLDKNIIAGVSEDQFTPFYTESDVNFLKGAGSPDILVTAEWPAGITSRSGVVFDPAAEQPVSQQCLADLCLALKPRYYFSTTPNTPYTREPFFYEKGPEDNGFHVTRFVSLSKYVEGKPVKGFLTAFSIDLKTPVVESLPSGATLSPFIPTVKKRPISDNAESSGLTNYGAHNRRGNKRQRGGPRPPPDESQCFFCLKNVDVAAHLIVDIDEETYVTIAKGPLPEASTFPKLGFPGHLLIIPLAHAPTLSAMTEAERTATYPEMQKYRTALNKMVKKAGDGDYGSITWELSMSRLMHTHWQYLPVPTNLIRDGTVETAFRTAAQVLQYPAFENEDVGDCSQESSDFFRIMMWDPVTNEDKCLVLRFNDEVRVNFRLGREVMSNVLDLRDRAAWKDCEQTKEEEVADVLKVRQALKEG